MRRRSNFMLRRRSRERGYVTGDGAPAAEAAGGRGLPQPVMNAPLTCRLPGFT